MLDCRIMLPSLLLSDRLSKQHPPTPHPHKSKMWRAGGPPTIHKIAGLRQGSTLTVHPQKQGCGKNRIHPGYTPTRPEMWQAEGPPTPRVGKSGFYRFCRTQHFQIFCQICPVFRQILAIFYQILPNFPHLPNFTKFLLNF